MLVFAFDCLVWHFSDRLFKPIAIFFKTAANKLAYKLMALLTKNVNFLYVFWTVN